MSKNIFHLLQQRKVCSWNWNTDYSLAQSVKRRNIRLSAIFDKKLTHRHVVLGFSHRGDCIISYACNSQFQELKYWLYWWHFNINKQLVLISKFELFRNEVVENSLYIVMYEDGTNAYIFGCRNGDGLESKPCYVSVIPSQSPGLPCLHHTLHFHFELFLPHPRVHMALNCAVPGCLLLNAGISLIFLTYKTVDKDGKSGDFCSFAQFTHIFVHHFSSSPTAPESDVSDVIRVFNGDEELFVTCAMGSVDSLVVKYAMFDIDSWISSILPSVLHEEWCKYLCLCDYNLEVIEMDLKHAVTFIVEAVVQVTSYGKLQFMKYVVTLLGLWHTNSKCSYKLLNLKQFEPRSHKWIRTQGLKEDVKKLILPCHMMRPLSNKSIFSGISLQEISHPHLPINLIL